MGQVVCTYLNRDWLRKCSETKKNRGDLRMACGGGVAALYSVQSWATCPASHQLIGIRFVLLIRSDLRNLRVFWLQRREERHYITEENGARAGQKWRPMPCPLRIAG